MYGLHRQSRWSLTMCHLPDVLGGAGGSLANASVKDTGGFISRSSLVHEKGEPALLSSDEEEIKRWSSDAVEVPLMINN